MRFLIAGLFVVLGSFHCWASLGESPTQSSARYGKPISHGDETEDGMKTGLVYYEYNVGGSGSDHIGGYGRIIEFRRGVSVCETIWKIDGFDRPSARPPMNTNEQKQLLDENGEGLNWSSPTAVNKDHPGYGASIWTRTDKATAMYSSITHEMKFSAAFPWR